MRISPDPKQADAAATNSRGITPGDPKTRSPTVSGSDRKGLGNNGDRGLHERRGRWHVGQRAAVRTQSRCVLCAPPGIAPLVGCRPQPGRLGFKLSHIADIGCHGLHQVRQDNRQEVNVQNDVETAQKQHRAQWSLTTHAGGTEVVTSPPRSRLYLPVAQHAPSLTGAVGRYWPSGTRVCS